MGRLYITREDLIVIGATQLTDEFDDAAPPVFVVPQGISRIEEVIVAWEVQEAAADDIATAAVQFRGSAVSGQPTISVGSGGIGAINTGVGQETGEPAFHLTNVDIEVKQGLPLQIFGLLAGEAGTNGNMAVTMVLS